VAEYDPKRYWSDRLGREFNLRGTGHIAYSRGYNAWLYRAKRRVLRQALRTVPAGAHALDVGSGTGWVVRELLQAGMSVDGCDLVPESVERLSAELPQVRFFEVRVGSEPLPAPDGRYGLVTALDVLYHITDDAAWESALEEIGRVMRAGAALVVTDGFGPDERAPARHVRFRSLSRWEHAADEAGLALEAVSPLYRWLSRDHRAGLTAKAPGALRGGIEYGLERLWPREPHMRCAVLRRRPSQPS
jgi:SAM-dependent methyltransferase